MAEDNSTLPSTTLFRKEAIESREFRLHGDVMLLAHRYDVYILACIILCIGALAGIAAVVEYNEIKTAPGQLDTSKNVLNFCIEACRVRRGSARRVVAV